MVASGTKSCSAAGNEGDGIVVGIKLVTPSTTEVMMLTISPAMGGIVGDGTRSPRLIKGIVGDASRDKAMARRFSRGAAHVDEIANAATNAVVEPVSRAAFIVSLL